MLQTEWLKVGTAGKTVDGREIKAAWLEKAAALYSPKSYTATVNSEHFFYPGLGYVSAVRAAPDEAGRVALYARIVPTAELLARYQSKRQLFFSMELMPDFPAEGDWYLTGLAVTDIPASQGLPPVQYRMQIPAGRERYYDTATLEGPEEEPWNGETNRDDRESEKPPGWFRNFLASIAPRLHGDGNPAEEEQPMTEQEKQAFDALQKQVEQLTAEVTALRAPEPAPDEPAEEAERQDDSSEAEGQDLSAADMVARIDASLAPLAERIGKIEAYLAQPKQDAAGDVTGPADGGEPFRC